MVDDAYRSLEREAARLHGIAPWLSIRPFRDPEGHISVEVVLTGSFKADPADLAGSLIYQLHRRLEEFEGQLDE